MKAPGESQSEVGAAGAPVCAEASLPAVTRAFEDFAAAHRCRVCYVCAAERLRGLLAMRPDLIVLDEPTTDLDPEGRAEVFALIRRLRAEGLSLIVIEHEAEELRASDRLLIMGEGEIVADGPPASVMARLDLLERAGVHPPDLNRALAMLGIAAHAESIDHAEAIMRERWPHLPDRGGASLRRRIRSRKFARPGPARRGVRNRRQSRNWSGLASPIRSGRTCSTRWT